MAEATLPLEAEKAVKLVFRVFETSTPISIGSVVLAEDLTETGFVAQFREIDRVLTNMR